MKIPTAGQVVRLRTRTYVVEEAQAAGVGATLVSLACLDDAAQGQRAEVVWEQELDTAILYENVWGQLGKRGFDDPRFFSAYIHTLGWPCVTATDPRVHRRLFEQ